MDSSTQERLFERLLARLEDWYADPQRAIDYASRPPVRTGKHGESKPALLAGRPPINWRTEWRVARVSPDPQARREQILWAILYELDPRAPQTAQYRDFYDQVRYRVESASTVGRPLIASRPTPGRRTSREPEAAEEVAPTHPAVEAQMAEHHVASVKAVGSSPTHRLEDHA